MQEESAPTVSTAAAAFVFIASPNRAAAANKAEVVAGSGDGVASRVRVYYGKNIAATGEPAGFQDLDPYAGAVLATGVFVG